MTWEHACVVLRGLLEFVGKEELGKWMDQVYKVYVGKFLVGLGRVSAPGDPD